MSQKLSTRESGFRQADLEASQGARISPSALVALAVVVAAVAANYAVSAVTDVEYTAIGDSVGNLLEGVVASTLALALVLVAAVTWLGWWRPVWRQSPTAGPRWAWLVPLGLALSLTFVFFAAIGTARTPTYMLVLLGATLLVGFAEELAFRGVLVVGLRERFGEGWVWFLSSLLFGLAHAGNAFNGQDVITTVFQVFVTFMIGSVLYVVRMRTGTLLVPIILHGLWDTAALSAATAAETNSALAGIGAAFQWITIILAFAAIPAIVRQVRSAKGGNLSAT